MLVLAVEEDVFAGEDVRVAFKEGRAAKEGETVGVGGGGFAEVWERKWGFSDPGCLGKGG